MSSWVVIGDSNNRQDCRAGAIACPCFQLLGVPLTKESARHCAEGRGYPLAEGYFQNKLPSLSTGIYYGWIK